MTTSTTQPAVWDSRYDPDQAARLAAAAYDAYAELLQSLRPDDWTRPTDCPLWTVRDMAGHNLGMAIFAASPEENQRMVGAALERDGVFIDELTGLQVEEAASLTTAELIEQYAKVAPGAAEVRRHLPAEVRSSLLPMPQHVGGVDEHWTVGYLVDVILTRDVWMHRVDTSRATGRDMVLDADTDGVLVNDVVTEWSDRHGQPYSLYLDGPAGGSWTRGDGGPELRLDAVEFCRILSGRAKGEGVLSQEVPF